MLFHQTTLNLCRDQSFTMGDLVDQRNAQLLQRGHDPQRNW